jgi:hypothetical protein
MAETLSKVSLERRDLLELRTASCAGAVEADVLSAKKVFAGRSVLRQSEGEVLSTIADERRPVQTRIDVNVARRQRVNLGPVAVALVIRGSHTVRCLADVDSLGSRVAELRVDVEAELVTRRDSVCLCGGADGGVIAALVANHVGRGDILDGRVVVGRSSDILVGLGDLTIDDEGLEVVVGEGGGENGSNSCENGGTTHLYRVD